MIASLLYSFPLDHKTEAGQLFWSGPKRPPQVLDFDPEEPVCLSFLVAASNIFAYAFGLDYCPDVAKIKAISKNIVMPKFEVKKIKIKEENDKSNEPEEKPEEDEDVVKNVEQKLQSNLQII